jgi:general secretion pathway protein L
MMHWLPFRFINADLVEWLTEDGQSAQGTPSEFANVITGSQQPLLVIPGEMVMLKQVDVPGRNRATLLKAIPYALEDNLAEDIDTLHFAVGPIQPNEPIPVAVIRHEILQGWLKACGDAGVTPAAAIPDTLLLPYEDGAWSLLLEEDRGVLRQGLWQGFVMEQANLELLLSLALTEAEERTPSHMRVWGEVPSELAHLALEMRPEGEAHPLATFAMGYKHSSSTSINLLQGPYSRQAQLGKWLRPWRVAAILAGCWLGLQIILQISDYVRLQQEQTYFRNEMVRIYREAVPNARRIVNPRAQLENRLQELRGTGDGEESVFLPLLYQSGQALQGVEGITLRGLRYKPNQLDLDLEGNSLEAFDILEQRFNELDQLNAQMRTTKQEDKAESRVTLRKAPS